MQWCGATSFLLSPLPCKARAPPWPVFPGSSIVRPQFTHMPVYQDAQLPTPFCFQPLPRKERALPWQHWPGNEASMLTDTSLCGRSAPSILLLASTMSRSKCYALASFSWHFKKEDKLLSTGRTNFVGAALSSSVLHL